MNQISVSRRNVDSDVIYYSCVKNRPLEFLSQNLSVKSQLWSHLTWAPCLTTNSIRKDKKTETHQDNVRINELWFLYISKYKSENDLILTDIDLLKECLRSRTLSVQLYQPYFGN